VPRALLTIILAICTACATTDEPAITVEGADLGTDILGVWYFNMGSNGSLKLNLKEDQSFEVSVVPCGGGPEEAKPSGTWSLAGNTFELLWPDGKTKSQILVSSSPCAMTLGNPKGKERYQRRQFECKAS
jgi:hypothetical protein